MSIFMRSIEGNGDEKGLMSVFDKTFTLDVARFDGHLVSLENTSSNYETSFPSIDGALHVLSGLPT